MNRILGPVGIAVVGGSLGALIIWSLSGQVSALAATLLAFVGWMFTLAGWFVGARLAERAQRQMFLHQLINSARVELVKEIRHEQDWVGGLTQLGYGVRSDMAMREFRSPDPLQERLFWLQQNAKGRQKLYPQRSAVHTLIKILEEYELLFPQTRHVRGQLGFFARERIAEPFGAMLNDIMHDARRAAAIVAIEASLNATADYSALLEDLRIHVQNASLAEITGRSVSLRQPLDPNVPIMTAGSAGMLNIAERGLSWPVATWPTRPWELVAGGSPTAD